MKSGNGTIGKQKAENRTCQVGDYVEVILQGRSVFCNPLLVLQGSEPLDQIPGNTYGVR